MRTLIALTTFVVIPISAGICAAGDALGQDAPRIREVIVARIQDLNLTDDQEAKIADIRKEHRAKIEESAKELAALKREQIEKVRSVLTVEQLDQLRELRDERQECRAESLCERIAHLEDLDLTGAEMAKLTEIRAEYRPKIASALEDLRGLLSGEQRKAREEALTAGKKRRDVIASIKLTSEQKEKVMAVGQDVRDLVQKEMEEVRDVLTDEQQMKLADLKGERRANVRDRFAHAVANCKELSLTDKQKTEIMALRKEYRPKIHEAGNKLRAAVREEIAAIADVIKD